MTPKECGYCKFNFAHQCRRYPPQVVMNPTEYVVSEWPKIKDTEFCGEFQPNEDG